MGRNGTIPQEVDTLITTAINVHASDIHIEPLRDQVRIRFRIDGILYDQEPIALKDAQQLISCIKIRAHLDSTQNRLPQDGTYHLIHNGHQIDLRVSSFPSLNGQTIVIRILDQSAKARSLDGLGFSSAILEQFNQLIKKAQGFLLVSGPTGSGKTTTLYAALSERNQSDVNIITLEDPIEYTLAGITQGQINPATGFTFENGMRSLLRQDPDIVMVGEIRDSQTAHIAIQAALTGHLVFSTVHTNDAPSVVMRLMDMGIEPFLINSALHGVLAQRLARRICDICKVKIPPTDKEKRLLAQCGIRLDYVYRGRGCETCMSLGYKGRIGIFELLIMSNTLRSLVSANPSPDALSYQAQKEGMQTLQSDGIAKVINGDIAVEELARVLL
jgi:type II secretory ATPase GspE/PulE/Tfp pilus assembly ATPase PilB-like protein